MKTKTHLKHISLLLSVLISSVHALGSSVDIAEKTKLLRFIDEKEPYTQSCEQYEYFSAEQRLKLLKNQNFMFGDILSDSVIIGTVDPEFIVETNITKCIDEDMDTNVFDLKEELEYINDDVITISTSAYTYGAGAAHGNSRLVYLVYDREYGFFQDWNALFGENNELDSYILKRVRGELADERFVSYFKAERNLLNYREKGYFGLTENGLVIQYGKYEIASGADGLPSLRVPKETLKKYINKEKYDKYFPQERTARQSIAKTDKDFIAEF